MPTLYGAPGSLQRHHVCPSVGRGNLQTVRETVGEVIAVPQCSEVLRHRDKWPGTWTRTQVLVGGIHLVT